MVLPINICLLTKTPACRMTELEIYAKAIETQLNRDVAPVWGLGHCIVEALEVCPAGYWPVTVMDQLDEPDALGYHDDLNGQPYANVAMGPDVSVTLSHEVIEMAIDPSGSRTTIGWVDGKQVNFLVEACDPIEDDSCTYTVYVSGAKVKVSDFCYPAYFQSIKVRGSVYCHSGRLDGPRELHKGGYFSYMNPETQEWFQQDLFTGSRSITQLGRLKMVGRNPRATVDAIARARKGT